VRLVTGGYFRSRKKDGGHAVRSAIGENLMLHSQFHSSPLCVLELDRRPVIDDGIIITLRGSADSSWHACIRCVCTCCGPFSVLWPWPWPNDLHIRTWPVLPGNTCATINFLREGFRKLSSDRQTDMYIQNRPKW